MFIDIMIALSLIFREYCLILNIIASNVYVKLLYMLTVTWDSELS